MLKGLICFLIPLLTIQSTSQTFYVKDVEVLTTYDARYVLRRTNQMFSSDRPIQQNDIDCFVRELKATGIFADVQARVTPIQNENFRKVLITTKYAPGIHEFTISEIVLVDLPELNNARFQQELASRGIKSNTPLLKYSFTELEETIGMVVRGVYPKSDEKAAVGLAWVTIRADGVKRVKLIVSPAYLGCAS